MLEYGFLAKISGSIKSYQEFPLPVAVCDREFTVYWSNPLAKSSCRSLTETGELTRLLAEFNVTELLDTLDQKGSCTILDAMPFSGLGLSLLPLYHGGEAVGVIVMALATQTLPGVETAYRASQTAGVLSDNLRNSVSRIFDTMDSAAVKADAARAGWLKPSLNRISMDGYQILRMADNVAEYIKFQNGAIDLQRTVVDLGELLEKAKETVIALAGEMGIPVDFELTRTPSVIQGDEARVELALFNLIHNSLYFTRPKNQIKITLSGNGDRILLVVKDRGIGIPDKEQAGLWRPYHGFSADGYSQGLGLGLTLVKAVMAAHGGNAALSSVPGEGTTVTLCFPTIPPGASLSFHSSSRGSRPSDRFSRVYTGLFSAGASPYRDEK